MKKKLFQKGDIVRVKKGCKAMRGEYAGRLAEVIEDSRHGSYPYKVEFLIPNPLNKAYFSRTRNFMAISLELISRGLNDHNTKD
jgi:hypothetical protein